MRRFLICMLLCIGIANASYSQNINRIEYFFGADPGFGNATAVTFTPSASVSDLAFTANTASLAKGFHFLQVRSRDANGRWSMVNSTIVYKDVAVAAISPNIERIEYFFDTDPGFGNATAVTLTPSASVSDFAFTANTASLSKGFHFLQVRSRDVNGKWSMVNSTIVYKDEAQSSVFPNIAKIEYFIDTDPGAGQATPIVFTASNNVQDLSLNADVTGLTNGGHYFFARSQDADGKFSVTNSKYFEVNNTVLPLTLLTYNATLNNQLVLNKWTTTDEVNTSHFIIERSINGFDFITVGQVEAKKLKGQQNNYFFNDRLAHSPIGSTLYYRLKMVDLDEKFSYSRIEPINLGNFKKVTLSPNPATNVINVYAPKAKEVSIVSILGNTVYTKKLNMIWDSTSINVETLPRGTYLVKVVGEDNTVTVEKVILR